MNSRHLTMLAAVAAMIASPPGAAARPAATVLAAVSVQQTAPRAARPAWHTALLDGAAILAPLDASWTRGPARWTHRDGGRFTLTRELDMGRVPVTYRARVGADVRQWTAAGDACDARIVGLAAESHFSDRGSVWDMPDPDVTHEPRAGQPPEEAWADGRQVLVARLEPVGAPCRAAPVLVADANARQPAFFSPAAVSDALAARAVAAFRALPEHGALQRDYDAALAEQGSWLLSPPATWDRFDGAAPRVTGYQRSDQRVLTVHVDTLSSCGDPGGALLGVFIVDGRSGALLPIGAAAYAEPLDGVVDLDGDGALEGIVVDPTDGGGAVRVLRLDALDSAPLLDAVIPDHTDEGCPC